jgi:hypothetical protein
VHGAAGHFELDASKSTRVGAPDGFAGDHVNAADGPAGVGVGVGLGVGAGAAATEKLRVSVAVRFKESVTRSVTDFVPTS